MKVDARNVLGGNIKMSSFICDKCGAEIIDTRHGYISGCEHYPDVIPTACGYCYSMTKIINGKCGKCGGKRWWAGKNPAV